ncbi:MoaD/ThiS family protein [Natronomonas sp. EA1]|uniref:MoaD/ThiS family protein n=1 Tax=Natronomonas sp. EA1 TaxID=3421655 RepID=UPI003EBF871A
MSVEVRLEGSLVARAGARRANVPVPEDATVEDVVSALAEKYGPHVRPAILEGHRLRTDTVAIRESRSPGERLTSDSNVRHGDRLRFEMRAY